MAHIWKRIKIRGRKTTRWLTVRALVDSGATHCRLPPGLARRAGLDPSGGRYRVQLANGRKLTVGGDAAAVRIDGREAPVLVLVADRAEPIVGVEALESLGVALDFRTGRLKPTRSYTVRLGGFR